MFMAVKKNILNKIVIEDIIDIVLNNNDLLDKNENFLDYRIL